MISGDLIRSAVLSQEILLPHPQLKFSQRPFTHPMLEFESRILFFKMKINTFRHLRRFVMQMHYKTYILRYFCRNFLNKRYKLTPFKVLELRLIAGHWFRLGQSASLSAEVQKAWVFSGKAER